MFDKTDDINKWFIEHMNVKKIVQIISGWYCDLGLISIYLFNWTERLPSERFLIMTILMAGGKGST